MQALITSEDGAKYFERDESLYIVRVLINCDTQRTIIPIDYYATILPLFASIFEYCYMFLSSNQELSLFFPDTQGGLFLGDDMLISSAERVPILFVILFYGLLVPSTVTVEERLETIYVIVLVCIRTCA